MRNEKLTESERTRLAGLFEEGRSDLGVEEAGVAVSRAGEKLRSLEKKGIPEALHGLWKEVRLLYEMVSFSVRGKYPLPLRSLGAAAFTLLYFVNPFDIVPDLLPLVGYIDDAFVISLCLQFLRADLDDFGNWKKASDTVTAADDETGMP